MRLTSCAKLAWRDLLGAPRSSASLVIVLGLSIAANTAIRATSQDFVRALGDVERAGIGGDLSVELNESPQPQELEALNETGARWTLITSTVFSVRSSQAPDPVLAVIKTVEPESYPFYGELRLTPAQPLSQALAGNSAIVSPDLLHDLGLSVGQAFYLNGVSCRITAVINREPDRFAGSFGARSRAIISGKTLETTRILRSNAPVLFHFGVAVRDHQNLPGLRKRLREIFPEATVFDPDSTAPGVDASKTASGFLNVLAWLALALGAGGVVVVTHLHIQSRLETLATLKCLGISNAGAFQWLAIELLLLGAGGGMIGLCAGLAARRPLLWMAGITASSAPGLEVLCAEAILLGIALPEVLGFAFILPAIRRRPALLLRREADFTPGRTVIPREGVFGWLVVCAVGGYFAGKALDSSALLLTGLAGGLLIVYGLFRAGFRLAHNAAGKRSLIGLPLSLRQGARNFLSAASNNQAVTVISAFVAMLTVLTGFGEAVVVREVSQSLPMAHADLYLTGFAHSQLRGIRSILDRQKDIEKPYDIRNFVWLRVGPAGQPSTSPLSLPLSLVACSTELPGGSGIVLDRNLARRFGVRAGSSLVLFGRDGETLEETVRTVRESPVAEGSWSGITIPCAPVDPLDMFHYAGLKVPEREIPALTRELNASYPALAVVSPREIFAQVTTIVGTGAALVKFVSVLSILTGLIVISALMAASARQRAHQIAVLRTLGASKWMILRILTCEFAVLGSLAGLLGGISGVLLADVALSVLLEKRIFDIHPAALGLAVSSGIVLSVVTGSLSCARFFSRRPLITLRCD